MDAKVRAADYARLIAVPAIWGGAFAAGKIVVAVFSPLMGSFARYAIACVALMAAAMVREGGLPRLTRRQLFATVLLGILGVFLYNLLFLGSLQRLPASRAALIIALNPAITIAISSFVLHERLHARRWLGVAIALLGVWVVLSHGDFASIASAGVGSGELLMFGAVTCWALYTIVGRKVLGGLTPLAATSYAALWGTLMLGAVAFPEIVQLRAGQFDWRMTVSLLYLGVLGTAVAFVWYYTSVQRFGASVASIFNNLVPVFGVLTGVLLLGEALMPSMLIGGVIAIVGVLMVSRA
ncbi:MAG TPA: DMT family transporter [Steroidobacteraceae bacterium]|jgi:drug/metabolite transporter (DMT)-like permease|nr:DMT family transporter [Steroidobacteraceae bacterium]